MKKTTEWGALNFGTPTRSTFTSAVYFYRKKSIMKRSCAIENRHKSPSGHFTVLREAAALCLAVLDKSLPDITHLQNIIFLSCSMPKFCVTSFLWFNKGQLTLTKTPRTFAMEKWAVCLDTLLWCQRPCDTFSSHSLTLERSKPNKNPANLKHACSIFPRINSSKKGRRSLIMWNSYTLLCWSTLISQITHC